MQIQKISKLITMELLLLDLLIQNTLEWLIIAVFFYNNLAQEIILFKTNKVDTDRHLINYEIIITYLKKKVFIIFYRSESV